MEEGADMIGSSGIVRTQRYRLPWAKSTVQLGYSSVHMYKQGQAAHA